MGNQTDNGSEPSWEGLSARDFYAYLATVRGVTRPEAKLAFLEWFCAASAQPAASEPDHPISQDCVMLGCPGVHDESAAPEADWERVTPAMLWEFEMGREQRDQLRALLEAAEARLAAVAKVRDLLLAQAVTFRLNPQVHSTYRECANRLTKALLTPTPSPGTGGGK